MPFGFQTIEYKDKLYKIQRLIKESHNPVIDTWKEHLGSDLVLKKEGVYYFLETIAEVQHIDDAEEIKELPKDLEN